MDRPSDPIAAVTHADPYPYYAGLVARTPLYRHGALGLWVASGAAEVTAVLASDACRVRPPAEPVPKPLVGSAAGKIFGHLVRMNDGERHGPFKGAVSATLSKFDQARLAGTARASARTLWRESGRAVDTGRVNGFAFDLPVHVVGSLLGIPERDLSRTALWMASFVRCLAPGSSAEQLESGRVAAGGLFEMLGALLAGDPPADGLVGILAGEARRAGRDDTEVIVANAVGFMSQAYEATAGLIGNTLVALGGVRGLRQRCEADPTTLGPVIDEVVRYDPPVQNTRRFVAREAIVAGQPMKTDDAILVVLAAANRDPAANRAPERFDIARSERVSFTFGSGVHACPGEVIAKTIARAGVERLLESGIDPESLARSRRYRPSANVRIPLFGDP